MARRAPRPRQRSQWQYCFKRLRKLGRGLFAAVFSFIGERKRGRTTLVSGLPVQVVPRKCTASVGACFASMSTEKYSGGSGFVRGTEKSVPFCCRRRTQGKRLCRINARGVLLCSHSRANAAQDQPWRALHPDWHSNMPSDQTPWAIQALAATSSRYVRSVF